MSLPAPRSPAARTDPKRHGESSAQTDIGRLLGNARRRQAGITLLSRVGVGLAAAMVCLLAGAFALRAGVRLPVRWIALGAAGASLLVALAWTIRDLVRRIGGDGATARTIAAADPSLRSALQSSVELLKQRDAIAAGGQLSVALVDAHVARTAERARTLDLARALPARPALRAGWLLLAVVGLHLVALAGGRGPLLAAYRRVLAGDPPGSTIMLDPITGDIELTYRYPAYMHREPRTISGTGGEVRAPRGTDVGLRTRADRVVAAAELVVELEEAAQPQAGPAPQGTGAGPESPAPAAEPPASDRKRTQRHVLKVAGGRDLAGGFAIDAAGSYRFRFFDAKARLLAEGPPIPIVVEPDAYPTVRITEPDRELEVEPGAVVQLGWEAEDDVGLGEVTLVLEPPQGEPKRIALRPDDPIRRASGSHPLAIAPLGLGEGERLGYRVEAKDGDTVSGPKVSSTETRFLRIYSAAEHRRQMLDKAKQVYEELVGNLGDRLDLRAPGSPNTADRLPGAQAVDARTRSTTEHLRQTARDIRRDPAGPREIAQALENVAQDVGSGIENVIAHRGQLAFAFRAARGAANEITRRQAREAVSVTTSIVEREDGSLERTMERSVLYLEQLLDKRRAEDLLQLAKDLGKKRRELAGLMENYRKAPTDEAKKDLLAQVGRMKEQVRDLLRRMAELSKGFNDEHMNQEALAELARSQDLLGGLDEVEKKLAQGDVEGAMKALDQLASAMDRMASGLSRTAQIPDERTAALMKEMLAFKDQLEKLEQGQKDAAAQTEKIRAEYRRRIREQLRNAEDMLKRLHALAKSARDDVNDARPGATFRSEPDFEASAEALGDLERALAMRELDGANEAVRRAQLAVEALSRDLELDSAGLVPVEPLQRPRLEDARRRVADAQPKVKEIRDELAKLFPDPKSVLSQEEQRRLGELSQRQGDLEQEAGRLQEALEALSKRAPVFPPQAQGQLGDSRGHMGQAAAELGDRNPQRGRGEQDLAMDALARFRKGLEDAAKSMQGGSGGGFPFPFAMGEGGSDGRGDGYDPSREKVKIPGAEAHKVPEAFRKDLLEAMKQGTPERYRSDVQRYYEELVK
jgi:hypothetical protein